MISIQYLLIFYMMYLTIFSFLNFRKKRNVKRLNIVIFVVFLLLDLFRYLRDGHHSVQFYDSGLVLTIVLIVLVYSLQGLRRLSMWLVAALSLLISSFISTIASGFLLTILRIELTNRSENPMVSIIGMFSGLLLFQGFNFLRKSLKLQINVYELSRKEIFVLILFVGMFGFYIDNIYTMIDENTRVLRLLINLLSLLIGVLPVYGMMYIMTQKDHIKYAEFRERQQELLFEEERAHYHQMNERNKEIQIFKHDIDDELSYISQLARNGRVDEISGHLKKMKAITAEIAKTRTQNTGSEVVNVSWYHLTNDLKYANIECEWLGKIPSNIVMDNRDLMKLFANLLKNAFEAAYQSQRKYVKVKIIVQVNRLAIVIKNSYTNEIRENTDGAFLTTKLEKENHGIGTRIIMDIIDLYDGIIHHAYDDNEFIVKIIFGNSMYK